MVLTSTHKRLDSRHWFQISEEDGGLLGIQEDDKEDEEKDETA